MTYDPLRCHICNAPVKRAENGFPRTFCSVACRRKGHLRAMEAAFLADKPEDQWREFLPERRRVR